MGGRGEPKPRIQRQAPVYAAIHDVTGTMQTSRDEGFCIPFSRQETQFYGACLKVTPVLHTTHCHPPELGTVVDSGDKQRAEHATPPWPQDLRTSEAQNQREVPRSPLKHGVVCDVAAAAVDSRPVPGWPVFPPWSLVRDPGDRASQMQAPLGPATAR